MRADGSLAARLRRVTGWPVTGGPPWVLRPPTGGEAVIETTAAALAWCEKQEERQGIVAGEEPDEWQQSELWAA